MRSAIETPHIGQHYMFAVPDLYNGNRLKTDILSEEYFLYRWWFPSDSPIVAYLKDYITKHPEDIDMKYMYSRLKKKKIGDIIYYALYFGKSTNGRQRIKQHIKGSMKNSTLRRTIYAILRQMPNESHSEKHISELLNQCYYEWIELPNDHELMGPFETIAIAMGGYPLNIEGNHLVSTAWIQCITH